MRDELERFGVPARAFQPGVGSVDTAVEVVRIPTLIQTQEEALDLLKSVSDTSAEAGAARKGLGLKAIADLAECAKVSLKISSQSIMSESLPSIQRISCPQAWT